MENEKWGITMNNKQWATTIKNEQCTLNNEH